MRTGLKQSVADKKAREEKHKDAMTAAGMKMIGAMLGSKLSEADMKEIDMGK